MSLTLRSVSIAVALTTGAVAAQAANLLVLPFQGTQSNSTLTFSTRAQGAFRAVEINVAPKGNATAAETAGTFVFPVTKVAVGTKLNIASGSAVGSALYISRIDYDIDTTPEYGVTLANFTINYETKQVLADTTAKGGAVKAQMPLYNFTVATPLALKYKFPMTVTGKELLNDLRFTDEAKAAFTTALVLPEFAIPLLDIDYGTLAQDISTVARKPAVPTKPYVAE